MSQENVEIVRRVYDAFASGDFGDSFKFYATDVEWDLSRGLTEGTSAVYHGHDGVRESFRGLLAVFPVVNFNVEDLTEIDDQVLATVHERYVGRGSGIEIDRHHYAVFTVQDNKISRMRVFLDRNEALEAVGLAE